MFIRIKLSKIINEKIHELYLVKFSKIKVYEFNEALLERYTKSDAKNAIVLVLIADTSKDVCVKNFKRDINLINE
jgi:hypothetical protein